MAQGDRRKRGLSLWLVIIVPLVVIVGICFLVWNGFFRDIQDGDDKDSDVQTVKKAESENDSDDNDDVTIVKEEGQVEKKKVVQYEGDDPNLTEELSGVVSYAGRSGDNMIIRITIDQYLREGSCVLELMDDGVVVYSKATSVVPMVSTSACDGFDIPLSELNSGVFGITVKVEAGEKNGVILGEINV